MITGLTWSDDSRRLYSVGGDGMLFVWKLSANMYSTTKVSWIDTINKIKNRQFDGKVIEDKYAPSVGGISHQVMIIYIIYTYIIIKIFLKPL
jgi:hypothetical protein